MAANKTDDSTARTNNNGSDTVAPRRRQSTILPKPTDLSIADFGGLTKFPASGFGQQHPGSQEGPLPPLYIPGHTEIFFDGQPVKSYEIVGFTYRMIAPDNENRSSMIRQTISRVTLRYELHIIQGPKRARACGSGPRSAADRRPVDPPPVVQLKIFDQDSGEDITSVYDSGFMLYASLENARPIAHGRFHPGGVPVLTGVAVASPAYLDKPEKAAYFIFPDLSVRHEGWYRLRFSLFEGVKKTYDADPDRPILPETDETRASREVQKHQGMANRMEVVSEPFQVFSAKKFPGLNPSTTISQDMADQGCRVRIRRDIRQRKRAVEKPDAEGVAGPYVQTPDSKPTYPDYLRSDSRNSVEHLQKMRRASDDDWQRPTPSRALSIASMSQASPLTPSAPQIPMGPPPTRQDWTSPRTTYDPVRHNIPLPSIQAQHHEHRQYNLPQATSMKRTHSPSTYEEDRPIKAGSRPTDPAPPPGPVDHSATIEVDENPSEAELQWYTYPSAQNGIGRKMGPPLKEV